MTAARALAVARTARPRDGRLLVRATTDRAANIDDPARLLPLVALFEALPEPAVFPVHPRTATASSPPDSGPPRAAGPLRLSAPVGYLDFTASPAGRPGGSDRLRRRAEGGLLPRRPLHHAARDDRVGRDRRRRLQPAGGDGSRPGRGPRSRTWRCPPSGPRSATATGTPPSASPTCCWPTLRGHEDRHHRARLRRACPSPSHSPRRVTTSLASTSTPRSRGLASRALATSRTCPRRCWLRSPTASRASPRYAELASRGGRDRLPTPLMRIASPTWGRCGLGHDAGARVQAGQLVVLESTTYPGTTERSQSAAGIVRAHGGRTCSWPSRRSGSTLAATTTRSKHAQGRRRRDDECLAPRAAVRHHRPGRAGLIAAAAELTKLFENVFRSVNIALVNELALLCDRMGSMSGR